MSTTARGPVAGASEARGAQGLHEEARREARLWAWQRLSAALLAACVLVHLAVMIFAVQGGLSAAEILGRTRGSWAFAGFYATFVLACAVHVPLGLANIAREWWGLGPRAARRGAALFAVLLLVLGLRAVWAVFAGGH